MIEFGLAMTMWERLRLFSSVEIEPQRPVAPRLQVNAERFRRAPMYDFAKRPTGGELYYERYPWGMDGDRFCALAADARRELGI